MIYLIFTVLVVAIAFSLYTINKRSKQNLIIVAENEEAKTFDEKMLLLQKESNNRLRGIDNTLDWFFWIMIISFVLTFLYYLMAELKGY
jgi:hypothetical protein